MERMRASWRIDGGRARFADFLPGGGAGIRGVCGNVHLEVAGEVSADVVDYFRVVGDKHLSAAGYAENFGLACR